jgi:hypothetical protein
VGGLLARGFFRLGFDEAGLEVAADALGEVAPGERDGDPAKVQASATLALAAGEAALRTGDRAAGFDDQPRSRQADGSGLVTHDRGQLGGEIGDWRRVVLRHIGNAEPSPEVDGVDLRGLLGPELRDAAGWRHD